MFTLNSELRTFVRTNPIAASIVMAMAVNGQDPNTIAITDYEDYLKAAKTASLVAKITKREDFPDTELGEVTYRDVRANYYLNNRIWTMEHRTLLGETFGEMLQCWSNDMLMDSVIAEHTRDLSATSLDFEARNIAVASHRVK